ncbi:MAG: hypothetical protein GX575_08295 [Candidatus Anammoximicrobium sp.]|nr:hypothetical protein [Candidatus Anammoximicrobium sp.]
MVSTVTTRRGDLRSQRDQVHRLLNQLAELLEDLADADADSSWGWSAVPTDAVPDRVSDLSSRLQTLFFLEENDGTLEELLEEQPELRDELEGLRDEHPQLLSQLEEVGELTGSSVRPVSTWDDVESRFHRFQLALSRHQRRHDDLGQRAALVAMHE